MKWVDHAVEQSEQSWTAEDNGGLHSATYRWRIQAWNDEGYGDWSDYAPEFTIDVGTPTGVATLLSPVGGVDVESTHPSLTWGAVSHATG